MYYYFKYILLNVIPLKFIKSFFFFSEGNVAGQMVTERGKEKDSSQISYLLISDSFYVSQKKTFSGLRDNK